MAKKFPHLDKVHNLFASASASGFIAVLTLKEGELTLEKGCMALLCILLRIKFWIDDSEYFSSIAEGKYPSNKGFLIGICVAMLSWIPWAGAAAFIQDPRATAFMMMIVFILSLIWVIVTWIDGRPYAEQVAWAFLSPIYAGCFFIIWKSQEIEMPLAVYNELIPFAAMAIILNVFLFDMIASKTIIKLARTDDRAD
ncbi:hypothetical protein [Roseomonas marmotae]|uniref:Uncharacterized protein n=1 Tax=Roseomonas marmotae TaxID=2768161 RepID=A0ABS3KHM6_9PROT|nr:hypothetical protein [Roseomonas marmotae]MBO1076932.1 hypothetical protein [Roseomonas marmotae]QTI82077.1 hypothetical protein IAI58_22245 [Roseomonas marmotae]